MTCKFNSNITVQELFRLTVTDLLGVNPNEEAEESDKQSDDDYENKDITNKEDWPIKEKIDEAHQSIDNVSNTFNFY